MCAILRQLSVVYAYIVSVMYRQKLLLVPHQQFLLCQVPFFFCAGQHSSATATSRQGNCPWFCKRRDIKAVLNMDPSSMSMTFSKYMHGCWITSLNQEHLLSIIVGICWSKENQQYLASSLSSLPWSCCGASGSFNPATGTHLVSSASPPALALLPTPCCWGPQTWAAKQDLEVCKGFPYTGDWMLSSPLHM